MKRITTTAILLFAAAGLFAITAKVVDTEGQATVRRAAGTTEKVALGKSYVTGDSIRTGKDGMVELSQSGLTIRVGPSTVFTLLEREVDGKPKGVLAVTLGTVKMKYDRLTGSEPMIQSTSAVAGVRGTELTVWAGTDGASQIIVDSGLVVVEAFGKSVELGPSEAVVVLNGEQPGDKFTVHREVRNHGEWDEGRVTAMLADPLLALARMNERLAYYAVGVSGYFERYLDVAARLKAERGQAVKIGSEQGKDAQQAYDRDRVRPLVIEHSVLVLNYRYFGLAALDMRRIVGGRMYALLKAKYLTAPDDPIWRTFLGKYADFVAAFEKSIMPVLVDADF